ncbi:MAG: transcription-repair coupling factor [Acidobacteria bacterium]|nr:transcription-repair coupling factor [Acidobacteriota bacterium]
MNHLRDAFKAALDSDAMRQLGAHLGEGCRILRISGAAGSSRALVIARLLLSERRSLAVITAGTAEAERLARDIQFFLHLLMPDPPPVVHFPSLEIDPYRGLSPHAEISAARAQALWHLLQDRPVVLVSSVQAAAIRLHSPQRFLSCCLMLEKNDEFSPEALREHLLDVGYLEDEPVADPGEFSIRGGIVDVFPTDAEHPVRMEFFGDRLESLRAFDVETQRSVSGIDRVTIVPMHESCVTRSLLQRWSEEVGTQWAESFLPHIESERAMARHGEHFPGYEFMVPSVDPPSSSIFDYLGGSRLVPCDREAISGVLENLHADLYSRFTDRIEALKPVLAPDRFYLTGEEFDDGLDRFPRLEIEELGISEEGIPSVYFGSQITRRYHGNIRELIDDMGLFRAAGERIALLFGNLGRAERVRDIFKEYEIPAHLCSEADGEMDAGKQPSILMGVGAVHAGFFLPSVRLRVLTGQDIFDEAELGRPLSRPKGRLRFPFLSDFRDLRPGDYVVHIDHGIGQFLGLKSIELQEGTREFVLLAYQNDARLYVPVERLDLIQKYSNLGGARPALDRLGGTSWNRTKSRIRKSMRDMAGELLKLYAQRQMSEGHAFSVDTAWQQEFDDAFEFELTPDQLDAIEAVKHDMEAPRPMDRLLCGDVGYGKTEVAMRASFKAVMDGKQVAVLAPTTVLAFQHYQTFRQRFTAFPVRIELLSRYRSPREQKQVLEELELGRIDIVIGTHRLLSRDVVFKDLGLLVVDEEQRFGVTHKERLKALKTKVDVLTLTATPIPRTLNMALLGLRDMSIIETPPKNRLAIQTSVLRYSPDVVRSAIELELARNGQVYFVHNRVETIHAVAAMVQQLVPRARVAVAHGQMSERELERTMLRFVQDKVDVLTATTIIENGLDIPRANTLIVNRADLYGLSQLYQLRGRVGRSDRRAYAYLLVPSDESLTEVARKRLAAIREFSDLGTGFRVAALDLEIRGAGNLLGGEQHGHIEAVGFDLYCQLLEQTVQELKGLEPEETISTSINLNLDIRIPENYISDSRQRLRMYKRISSAQDRAQLDSLRSELIDRYGSCPEPVENLFRYARLRQETLSLQIQAVERRANAVCFRFLERSRVSAAKLLDLACRSRDASLSPQGVLTISLPDTDPERMFESIHRVLDQIHA